jgi:hypothetical protein
MGGSGSSQTIGTLSPQLNDLIIGYLQNAGPELSKLLDPLQGDFNNSFDSAMGAAAGLQNFQALSPAQIADISSQAGAAVESAGRTAAATSGGVPNPALQNKNLAIQAGQQTGQTATQIAEIVANQNLGAKTAAANTYSNLSSQSIQSLLSALGIQAGALGTGVQGQLGVGNLQNQQQQEKNQTISSAFGGLANLGGDFLTGGLSSGLNLPSADYGGLGGAGVY